MALNIEDLNRRIQEFNNQQKKTIDLIKDLDKTQEVFSSYVNKQFTQFGQAGKDIEAAIANQKKLAKEAQVTIDLLKSKGLYGDEKFKQANAEYIAGLEKAAEKTGILNRFLAQSGALLMGVKGSYEQVINNIKDFYTSGSEQLIYFEKAEKSIRSYGRNVGLLGGSLDGMSHNMRAALPHVARYGGDMDDIAAIMKDLAETSGRVTFLSQEDIQQSYNMQKALGLSSNEVASMKDSMGLFGVGVTSAVGQMQELANGARRYGLNSKAVIKEMNTNMAKASTFSFRRGTKGMMDMAKHAVNMRMDMSSILGMAQDLWTPEKAIETAAELQVLGGNFAREFGDPFKLMYAARNEPEKLAKSLQGAIESVYQFNDATGEFESSGFEMQRLQIAAQKLGLDFQQLNKSAMQAAKSTVIDSQINFTATDEEKAFLANVAQIGAGGAATVKIAGEEIKVEDLGRERLEQLQESTIENEQDYFESSMKQYQTQTDVLTGIRELAKAQLASSKLNLFLNAEKLLKGTTQEVGGFANMFGDDAKKGDFTKTIGKITNVFNTMGSAMGVDNVMGMFNNITKDDDSVGGKPAQGAKTSKTYTTAQRTAATQQALNKIANMGVKHSGTVKHTMHVTVGPGVTAPLQAAMVSQGIPYLESTGGSYTTHGPEENKSSK